MEPFFYKLNTSIISQNLKETIIEISKNHLGEFQSYKGQKGGKVDGNNYYFGDLLNTNEEVNSLIQKCSLKCYPIIMLHYPNTLVLRHIDNPNKRNCVLITPIYPKENYSPTWFWKPTGDFETWEDQDLTPVATCEFDSGNSVVLNTQKPHSLKSNETFRFNFQLCFEDNFEVVVNKLKNNSLFLQ